MKLIPFNQQLHTHTHTHTARCSLCKVLCLLSLCSRALSRWTACARDIDKFVLRFFWQLHWSFPFSESNYIVALSINRSLYNSGRLHCASVTVRHRAERSAHYSLLQSVGCGFGLGALEQLQQQQQLSLISALLQVGSCWAIRVSE